MYVVVVVAAVALDAYDDLEESTVVKQLDEELRVGVVLESGAVQTVQVVGVLRLAGLIEEPEWP